MGRLYLSFILIIFTVAGFLAGCGRESGLPSAQKGEEGGRGPKRVYVVKGVVVSVKPREKSVEIRHEAIPDYMPAMTMPFDVKNTNVLSGLEPGERVEFRLAVTDTDGWIEEIKKVPTGSVGQQSPAGAPTGGQVAAGGQPPVGGQSIRRVKDVEPIQIGEPLPEYQLTNQFGQVFSTRRYLGQALAITFLFTRCPYPTFCPRMADNFEEVQKQMLARAGTNWQLLTISFDPEFDKPEVLKSYAQMHHYEPAHWTFATGSLMDVTALGDEVGLTFWHDETGSISHNLRTVVVDAAGKVQQIFVGNQWSSGELVEEMVKAEKQPRMDANGR